MHTVYVGAFVFLFVLFLVLPLLTRIVVASATRELEEQRAYEQRYIELCQRIQEQRRVNGEAEFEENEFFAELVERIDRRYVAMQIADDFAEKTQQEQLN